MTRFTKMKSGNVHFLKLLASKPNAETSHVEALIQNLARRLDHLESGLNKQLRRLEKKPNHRLYEEIKTLKISFDKQVEEMITTLQDTLKKEKPQPPSFINYLTEILKKSGLFDKKTPSLQQGSDLEEEVDPFGRDPAFEKKLKPFFDFLYYRYWRVTTYGLENIPKQGRALLVANHSGTLPYDGSMIRLAVTNEHPAQRDVRFLVEDFVYYLPFVGTYMYRIGGVRASPENAERLLRSNHLVAVFPEGVKGIGKYYSQRYHLQRFGRGGFIKLAIRTGSPIIPVAVLGAEEIHPMLFKSSLLAKPLGIPYVPMTPTFPLLGPLGLIPFPSKWSIYFGKPIDLRPFGKQILDDELEIHKLSEMVRQTIQNMVTEALKHRRSVWWG